MGANNSTFKDEQAMEYDIQSPSDPMKDELTLTRKKLNIYRSTLNECAMECLKSGKPLGEDAELLALSRAIDELILQSKGWNIAWSNKKTEAKASPPPLRPHALPLLRRPQANA